MQTAISNIRDPETWLAQGNGFLSESDFQNALDAYRRCLSIAPRMVEAHYNCGVAFHLSGDLIKAVSSYRTAIGLSPDLVEAHFNLGHAMTDLFQFSRATDAYLRVLCIQPDHFNAAYNLADLYKTMGDFRQAEHYYKQALRNKPDYAEAWNNLGVVYSDQGQLDQAIVCLEQALAIQPEMARAWFNLGIIRHKKNEYEASLALFEKALTYDPEYAPAHWHHALLLPMLYRLPEEVETSRQRYKACLEKLVEHTPLETEAQRRFALEGVGSTTNFYLQYQGADDTVLQKRYGDFAAAVMSANFPQWSVDRAMPPLNPGGRLRIGYVSSLVYGHTIGIFLSGWIKHHDRNRFELFCYHVGAKTDELTEHVRKSVDHFHHITGSLEAAARQIENDALHVLIHTDVGMNPLTFQLAALRLAPIQCKGWGHPVTTGLPTMDYYLSSDLMEPPEADTHYSETLVRLPNLALCHEPPAEPDSTAERDMFAIPGDRFVFLCAQSLFKYLPQHDHLYPEIALLAPKALFVFIAHDVGPVTTFFRNRLASSFGRFGLTFEDHCQFVQKQNHAGFMKLNRCADVVLDSFMWSGGKSSMEALWCGTPVITLPGDMMRGRHAYAFLKRIGAEKVIASDAESYIRIAARCATDKEFLNDVRAMVRKKKHLLYGDKDVISALEVFLQKQVHSRRVKVSAPSPVNITGKAPEPDLLVNHHYRQGQTFLAADRPDLAQIEFEKTLAWIPNHLGIHPWFQNYLLDGHPSPHCPPGFMGQLYAMLGRCMKAMDRVEDSRQYAQAALRFDNANRIAQKLLHKSRIRCDGSGDPFKSTPAAANCCTENLDPGRLSLLMITNATRKLQRNIHLGAPATGLVEQTYTSLLSTAGQGFANTCTKFLCFDRPAEPGAVDRQYEDNLKAFADRFGFIFQVFDHCGLRDIVRAMVDRLQTPYLLLLEHDWRFLDVPLHLDRLVQLFDKSPHIHALRLNKRPNIISNFDFLLKAEQGAGGLALLRTPCHSNNPSILRVSTLKRAWLPVCLEDPVYGQMDLRGKAFGLEEPLFKRHIQDMRRLGFHTSHPLWGTYLYGAYEDPRRIEHLGE